MRSFIFTSVDTWIDILGFLVVIQHYSIWLFHSFLLWLLRALSIGPVSLDIIPSVGFFSWYFLIYTSGLSWLIYLLSQS